MLRWLNNAVAHGGLLLLFLSSGPVYAEIDFDNLDKAYQQLPGKTPVETSASGDIIEKANRAQAEFREKDAEQRVQEARRLNEYKATHPPCEDAKSACYKIIKEDQYDYTILCTHGKKAGTEYSICSNGKGKWMYSCGVVTLSYHYDSFSEAAILACEL